MVDLTDPGQISSTASVLVAAAVPSALLGGLTWAILGALAQSRRAAQARASMTAAAPPRSGPAVLRGTVESYHPERPAVSVTLWERGEEQKGDDGFWTHQWVEERREVLAEPFMLRLSSGDTVVHVEPGTNVFLVDSLELAERGNPRTRRAQLTTGEQAFVSGVLGPGGPARADVTMALSGSAYRGAPSEGLTLRAGAEPMLVSTEPLDLRFVRLGNVHRLFALLYGVALFIAVAFLYGRTLLVAVAGKHVEAEVVSGRSWTTSSNGYITRHYALTARYQDSAGRTVQLENEVSPTVHEMWKTDGLRRLPFVVLFDKPALDNFGEGPTIPVWSACLPATVTAVMFLVFRGARYGAREWYDRRPVAVTASGRLQP